MQVLERLSHTWTNKETKFVDWMTHAPGYIRPCSLTDFIDMLESTRDIMMSSLHRPMFNHTQRAKWTFPQKTNMIFALVEMCRLVYYVRLAPLLIE